MDPALVWPPPPAQPRYRYVGQLRGSQDVKPPPNPFTRLGEWIIGAPPPDSLYGPRDVLCTTGDRLWIADPGGRCVHLMDLANRTYHKIEHVGPDHMLTPVGLCLGPEQTVYVCDSELVAIIRLWPDGSRQQVLQISEDIRRPAALHYDEATDTLYVVDVSAHDIKVLDRDGGLRRIIGRRGSGPGEFNFPCDVAFDGQYLWVADTGNHRIQAVAPDGTAVAVFGQAGDATGDLALPKGVALDSTGNVYVVDARFENIQVFDQNGQLLLPFGEEGTGPGQFWLPSGIFVDHQDRIWVCDSYNGRIQVFQYLAQAAR